MIKIRLNGKDREIKARMSISQIIEELKLKSEAVVVEMNLKVLNKAEYESAYLKEGDNVEIINIVGGG